MVAAVAVVRFARAVLYGVRPTDPATYGEVAVVVLVAAIAACRCRHDGRRA